MTVNFPTSPSDGTTHTSNTKTWTYDSAKTKWKLNGASGSSGGLNIFGNTTSSVADTAALNAKTGMAAGDQIYVEDINKVYKYSGSAWILVASLTNSPPPALDSLPNSIYLRIDGVANSVTLTETDPEGYPLTWSYAVTSGAAGNICTVNLTNNVLTFTPSSNSAHAGSFGITVSVTDHMNATVTKSATVILDFNLDIKQWGHNHIKDLYQSNNYLTKSIAFGLQTNTSAGPLIISPDGLRAWQEAGTYDTLFEYTLSSAWDVSTIELDYTKQSTHLRGYIGEIIDQMAFNNDGTKMYFAADGNEPVESTNKLIQVDLGTAYDTSTIDGSSVVYLTAEHPTAPHTHVEGFCFSANGSYLYITEDGVDDIFQFTLSTPWDITTAAYTAIKTTTSNTYGLYISSDGSIMYLLQNGALKQCAMSTPYDITTLNYSSPTNELDFDASNYAASLPLTKINTVSLLDLAFSSDGTKFIIFGTIDGYQYHMQSITLSTPWDISTSSQSSSSFKYKYISNTGHDGTDCFFLSSDGSKFFIEVRKTNPSVIGNGFKQFTLANAGDLRSIQFPTDGSSIFPDVNTAMVSNDGDMPNGITFADGSLVSGNLRASSMTFNHDGTKLVFSPTSISNGSMYHIFQWNCPTPYDLTSITSSDMISPYYVDRRVIGFGNQNTVSDNMTFSNDGSKFYHIQNGQIAQCSCSAKGSIFGMTLDTGAGGGATGHFATGNPGGKFRPIPNSTGQLLDHLGAHSSGIHGITWHPDGYKFYLATNVSGGYPCIVELSVAVPFDLYTVENPLKHRWIIFGNTEFISGKDGAEFDGDIQWNSDGTILYLSTIYQHNVSAADQAAMAESNVLEFPYIGGNRSYITINAESPYNLKWSYADDIFHHDVGEPRAFQIKPDGTKFWICDNTTDDVIEYNMSTPHQLSSATEGNRLLNVESNASGMYFAPDGSHLVTCGYSSDKVRKWDMSTAWDISTATVDATQEIALSSGGTTDGMLWVQYNNDGTKIYVFEEEITIATMSAKLIEYPLSTAYNLSTAGTPYVWLPHSSVVQPDRPTTTWSDDNVSLHSGRFNDLGDTLIISAERADTFYSFELSTPWDLSTINNTPSAGWTSPYEEDNDRMMGASPGQDHLIYLSEKHIFRIYRS